MKFENRMSKKACAHTHSLARDPQQVHTNYIYLYTLVNTTSMRDFSCAHHNIYIFVCVIDSFSRSISQKKWHKIPFWSSSKTKIFRYVLLQVWCWCVFCLSRSYVWFFCFDFFVEYFYIFAQASERSLYYTTLLSLLLNISFVHSFIFVIFVHFRLLL